MINRYVFSFRFVARVPGTLVVAIGIISFVLGCDATPDQDSASDSRVQVSESSHERGRDHGNSQGHADHNEDEDGHSHRHGDDDGDHDDGDHDVDHDHSIGQDHGHDHHHGEEESHEHGDGHSHEHGHDHGHGHEHGHGHNHGGSDPHLPRDLSDLLTKLRQRIEDSTETSNRASRKELEDLVSWVAEYAADTDLAESDWIPLYEKSNRVSSQLDQAAGPITESLREELISLCELIDDSVAKIPTNGNALGVSPR